MAVFRATVLDTALLPENALHEVEMFSVETITPQILMSGAF